MVRVCALAYRHAAQSPAGDGGIDVDELHYFMQRRVRATSGMVSHRIGRFAARR